MTLFYFFLEEKMCPGFGVPLISKQPVSEFVKKEKREFLPFEEFQKEVKALYPKKGDVKKWYTKERKNHTNWPAAPNRTYKDRGWTSWPELVGKNKE